MELDSIKSLISAYEEVSIYTSNKIHEAVEGVLRSHGITYEQMCLLRMIYRHHGISSIQISEALDINKSGVSIRVNRLIAKGYVEKQKIDNRSFGLYITANGRAILQEGEQKIHDLVGKWIEEVGEEDSKEFIRIYTKINETIRKQKVEK
ncbi:MarR family winged helix-turn-helix transcriptional regulator [Sporolactobacillus inulinus]|jgi:DNA-binding MarR family transcriptional regulator|uniref:HTH marR-type domain-containing protein n=1 Tax=Sporolactobacillus inulinus CASD TaxID=1069536 RepID=A0A0U1QP75_9BACL|nr:MarR family transcriptional regulator [Sporolactobacillus inulinus]KLI02613.1 hypothetical protein SINU_07325 [Sporolactobacillus inulinus CASD]GEB76729.1 hypothetical protein SIN01_10740 [Sporolactobacillus inulinus]